MDGSEQILVIILSITLAILLIISIFVAVIALKVVKSIQRITTKAELIVENVEHVGETFKNAAGPLALFKVINNIARMVAKQKTHSKK